MRYAAKQESCCGDFKKRLAFSLLACQLVGLPAKKYRIINMGIVKFEKIENNIIELRGQKVILDSDVADLYKVETRDVNKSVKNNPDKFPEGYIFELTQEEFEDLRWKF